MSEEGTLVYATGFLRGSRREPMRIVHVQEGRPKPLPFAPQLLSRAFVLSPDGSRLAVNTDVSSDVLLIDVRRGTTIRVENTGLTEVHSLAWTPDGRSLRGPRAGQHRHCARGSAAHDGQLRDGRHDLLT